MAFTLTVKNGDSKYNYNAAKGQYDFETVDYVSEPVDLTNALIEFLEWLNDEDLENKVTLSFKPAKVKKDKKK